MNQSSSISYLAFFSIAFSAVFSFCFLLSAESLAFDHSYKQYGKVLSQFVVSKGSVSKVKYLALKKQTNDLDSFLSDASKVTQEEYKGFSEKQKLAFLFNSYNAFTIKHILNHHSEERRLASIKDIGSLFKNSWKIKFFQFLGEESNLDRLEHELARPNFDEPRMHFAFNCASKGCPAILPEPFLPEQLDQQLEKAAVNFLSDRERNLHEEKSDSLQLSAIFKWYGEDFEKSKRLGPLNKFLAEHMPLSESNKAALKSGKIKIKYLEYDWALNSED